MLTIFSTPKDFVGHFGVIQRNAMRSWRALGGDVEILLFDESVGCAKIVKEINAQHIPELAKNENGTPFLNDMFRRAQGIAHYDMLAYVNADIVLPPAFVDGVEMVRRFNRFLMVGRRWNLDWTEEVDFRDDAAAYAFFQKAEEYGEEFHTAAIDYFVFSKELFKEIPDFLVGRVGFDNWLIWKARRRMVPVIDASSIVKAVHQNHDYSHLPTGRFGAYEGPEAQHNRAIHGKRALTISDTTWKLTDNGPVRKKDSVSRSRQLSFLPRIFPELAWFLKPLLRVYKGLRRRLT